MTFGVTVCGALGTDTDTDTDTKPKWVDRNEKQIFTWWMRFDLASAACVDLCVFIFRVFFLSLFSFRFGSVPDSKHSSSQKVLHMFHTVIRYGSWMNKLPERTGEKEKNRSKYGRRQQHLLFFFFHFESRLSFLESQTKAIEAHKQPNRCQIFLYRVVIVVGHSDEWILFDCLENGFEAIKEACDSREEKKQKLLFICLRYGFLDNGRPDEKRWRWISLRCD